ncbi:hypothetical protein AVEN_32038-1 [Araneus ventricosus]|uniref:Uncharacterized protein n=1 Tax=Araneus ventricosus TaxID=182803 RepID=A0A4Y2JUR5_ARAVE|nr:hypothetical protein AVEN_32038-1 [Araneus ventricosus]
MGGGCAVLAVRWWMYGIGCTVVAVRWWMCGGDLVLSCWRRSWRVPVSKPDSAKDLTCMCPCCTLNLPLSVKRPQDVVRKLVEVCATSGIVLVI